MKKIILLSAVMLLAAGCSAMTNDQIISETKKCTDAGLKAEVLVRNIDSRVVHVQCKPDKIQTTE